MDYGLLITGAAVVAAFSFGRGKWIRHLLLVSWLIVLMLAFYGATMATFVGVMAGLDITIAAVALAVATHNPRRVDAKMIGGISMALMPAHWTMAITGGAVDWRLYASICNGAFVLQCLVIGGWLDGVGRSLGDFIRWTNPLRLLRNRGR